MNTLEHLFSLALPPSESARACRACGRPITLDDAFGLSEGVCAACRVGSMTLPGRQAPPASGILAWLRRQRWAA